MIIAIDVDGTLFDGSGVDPEAIEAIGRAREAGHHVMIATGRPWRDLATIVPGVLDLIDWAVCEDGAVIVDVGSGDRQLLAPPPGDEFLAQLAACGATDVIVGDVALGMPISNAPAVDCALGAFADRFHAMINKDSIAILPHGCNKASGLRTAIEQQGLGGHQVLAIGDASNDLPMFRLADMALAVANADEAVRQAGIELTRARTGAGVAEAIDRHLASRN